MQITFTPIIINENLAEGYWAVKDHHCKYRTKQHHHLNTPCIPK